MSVPKANIAEMKRPPGHGLSRAGVRLARQNHSPVIIVNAPKSLIEIKLCADLTLIKPHTGSACTCNISEFWSDTRLVPMYGRR